MCDVCGVFIQSTDNEARRRDHLEGKQYLGWLAIREKHKELMGKYAGAAAGAAATAAATLPCSTGAWGGGREARPWAMAATDWLLAGPCRD